MFLATFIFNALRDPSFHRIILASADVKRDINSTRASYFHGTFPNVTFLPRKSLSLPFFVTSRSPSPPICRPPFLQLSGTGFSVEEMEFPSGIEQKLIHLNGSLYQDRSDKPLIENRSATAWKSWFRYGGGSRLRGESSFNGATQDQGYSKGRRLQAIVPVPPFVSNLPFYDRPPPPFSPYSSFFVFLIRNFVTSPSCLFLSRLRWKISLTLVLRLAFSTLTLPCVFDPRSNPRCPLRRPSRTIIFGKESLRKSFRVYSVKSAILKSSNTPGKSFHFLRIQRPPLRFKYSCNPEWGGLNLLPTIIDLLPFLRFGNFIRERGPGVISLNPLCNYKERTSLHGRQDFCSSVQEGEEKPL